MSEFIGDRKNVIFARKLARVLDDLAEFSDLPNQTYILHAAMEKLVVLIEEVCETEEEIEYATAHVFLSHTLNEALARTGRRFGNLKPSKKRRILDKQKKDPRMDDEGAKACKTCKHYSPSAYVTVHDGPGGYCDWTPPAAIDRLIKLLGKEQDMENLPEVAEDNWCSCWNPIISP